MIEKKYICDFPWTQLYNTPSGTVTPCCVFGEPIKKDDGTPFLLQKDSIQEIFQSNYLKNLRESFNRGEKPNHCDFCWKQENLGYESRRIQNNQFHKDMNIEIDYDTHPEYPIEYEVILSNSCNLKCRSCNSILSTQWLKEQKKFTKDELEILDMPPIDLSNIQVGYKDSKYMTDISEWAPHVRKIQTLGGEPLYGDTWKYVIDYLIENGHSKQISLSISTNGTLYDEEFIKRLCDNFESITIGLSIDGQGQIFEFLRKNGKWNEVEENIINYQTKFSDYKNYEHYFRFTVSWINALFMPDFEKWVKNTNRFSPTNYGILFEPHHMALWNIPTFFKQKIKEKLESTEFKGNENNIKSLIEYMFSKSPTDSSIKNSFIKFKIIDKYRNESTLDIIKNIDSELYNFYTRIA